MSQCVPATIAFAYFQDGLTPELELFSSLRHGELPAMMVTKIIDAFGYVIYAALALLAVWGVYNGILLVSNSDEKDDSRAGAIHRPGS